MRLKLVKVTLTPIFQLVDDAEVVVDETSGEAVVMFPGKSVAMEEITTYFEKSVNTPENIEALRKRPLW